MLPSLVGTLELICTAYFRNIYKAFFIILCMTENEKTNVTLRISKEVIDKARELDINLSSITESMLKTESFVKGAKLATPKKMRETYRKIFIHLSEILKDWEVYLKIGEDRRVSIFKDAEGKKSLHEMDYIYYLSYYGTIEACDDDGEALNEWGLHEEWPVNILYEPEKLIENLINILYGQAQSNEDKLKKLSLLKNVLEKIKPEKIEGENAK